MAAAELAALIGTTEARVREEFGIHTKAVGQPGESALDHALGAARAVMADEDPAAIGLLVYTSSSPPDHLFWTGAYKLHDKLGLKHARVMELNVGCIGGLYALEAARDALVADPRLKRALVVAAEGFHFDPTYPNYGHAANEPMYILADGAAAVVLASDREGPLQNRLGVFARRVDASLHVDHPVPAGGAKRPTTVETAAAGEQFLTMQARDQRSLHRFGLLYVAHYLEVLREALGPGNKPDWLVSNQLKLPLMKILVGRLGLPFERAVYTMPKLGHVGTADVLLGLENVLGRMAPGETAGIVASGVGFAWGATTLTRL